jgi:hypothetical protein
MSNGLVWKLSTSVPQVWGRRLSKIEEILDHFGKAQVAIRKVKIASLSKTSEVFIFTSCSWL